MIHTWALFMLALALLACSDAPGHEPPQLVLLVDAEPGLRTQLDRVEVQTERASASMAAPGGQDPGAWPLSIGISPRPDQARGALSVRGYVGDQEVVRRTVDLALDPARRPRALSVLLTESCRNVFATCDALDQGTCLPCRSDCGATSVDGSQLPELTKGEPVARAWLATECHDDPHEGGMDATTSVADGSTDADPGPSPGMDASGEDAATDSGHADGSVDSGAPPARTAPSRPLAVSHTHLCAIRGRDREVYCLGSNGSGQLGVASGSEPVDFRTPVRVGGATPLVGAVQVAVGHKYSCALLDNRRVYCWGARDYYETGTRDRGLAHLPYPVVHAEGGAPPAYLPLEDIVQVIAGIRHGCALNAAGQVFCWGANGGQELGLDSSAPAISGATQVSMPGDSPVRLLGRGGESTCAVTDAEQVFCWGNNQHGQAGVTPVSDGGVPLVRRLGTPTHLALEEEARPVKDISGSIAHMALLADNQSVWTWGSNFFGQLGRSAPPCDDPELTPYQCTGVPGQAAGLGGSGITLSTVGRATCIIDKPDRQLWCMDGSVSRVGASLSQVSLIAGDTIHNVGCALTVSGEVHCWGSLALEEQAEGKFGDYPDVVQVALPSAE